MDEKTYLTIEGVAKRFAINQTTVYRLAQRGQLPGFKIGGQWRFDEQMLETWVAEQVGHKAVKKERGGKSAVAKSLRASVVS